MAGLPVALSGTKRDLVTGLIQAVMQRDTDGALEVDTLDQRVQGVAGQFRDIPFTGSLTAPDPAILHRVLHADPTPQPPAVAAAAVRPALDPAKQVPRKSQPRQALPATVQPTAANLPLGPKPGQIMCDLGSKCRRTTLARDPKDPSKTVFVTRCAMWHDPTQFPGLMRTIRAEFDAASSLSPAPPAAMPVPAVGSPAAPGRIPQADIVKDFIARQRPAKPSLPAVRPEGLDDGVLVPPDGPAAPASPVVAPALVTRLPAPAGPIRIAQADAIADFVAERRRGQPLTPAARQEDAGDALDQPGEPCVPAIRPEDIDVDVFQAALDGYELALTQCAADAYSDTGDGELPRWHHDIIRLWETYIRRLAANLPHADGVALLAAAARARDRFILDTGSFFNIGPHLAPDGLPDTCGAVSALRTSSRLRHTQTAGGNAVPLAEIFDCRVLVRTIFEQLIELRWLANHLPGLRTTARALHVVSGSNLVFDNNGEMVSRPLARGGPHFRVMTADEEHPDEPAFLSDRIPLDYKDLGAAEFSVATRRPGERNHLAILRPSSDSPSDGPVAVAVRAALRAALAPPVGVPAAEVPVAVPEPDARSRLLWFVADLNLQPRVARLVDIVDTYPLDDELDVELPPDLFYSVTPSYFEWDDRQSGIVFEDIYRRMIQRYSRQLVHGPPALPYAWLGCDAAQVLAAVEQQLSMLVQGLVKARTDAVDGDGAMPRLPAEQLAAIAAFDFNRRLEPVRKIDLSVLTARLVVAGPPRRHRGNRRRGPGRRARIKWCGPGSC